jgi:hypothetical protein
MDELVTLGLPDWSEFSIQFTMEDQWTSFFDTCHYHLVLDPIIVGMQITKVLIDGGAGINIIFASTLNKMGLKFSSLLIPTDIPFYGIIPDKVAMPLGQITLPVTFGTPTNFRRIHQD